jgi:hypothetical protein
MPGSSTQVEESRTQPNGTGAGTVAPGVTRDGFEISKMLLQKASDECLAIVEEERTRLYGAHKRPAQVHLILT